MPGDGIFDDLDVDSNVVGPSSQQSVPSTESKTRSFEPIKQSPSSHQIIPSSPVRFSWQRDDYQPKSPRHRRGSFFSQAHILNNGRLSRSPHGRTRALLALGSVPGSNHLARSSANGVPPSSSISASLNRQLFPATSCSSSSSSAVNSIRFPIAPQV